MTSQARVIHGGERVAVFGRSDVARAGPLEYRACTGRFDTSSVGRLESFTGIWILTTNHETAIDEFNEHGLVGGSAHAFPSHRALPLRSSHGSRSMNGSNARPRESRIDRR